MYGLQDQSIASARAATACLALLVVSSAVSGQASDPTRYQLTSFDADTHEPRAHITRTLTPLDDGLDVLTTWFAPADSSTGTQRHIVDADHATLRWEMDEGEGSTRYTGVREGNVIRIEGRLHGEDVLVRHEIDGNPLHVNPAIGLRGFVLSDDDECRFWTIRPDNLSKYQMRASKKAIETIEVAGDEVECVRVRWGLTGLRALFFSQTMWFRVGDGMFMKSKPSRGEWTEFRPTSGVE